MDRYGVLKDKAIIGVCDDFGGEPGEGDGLAVAKRGAGGSRIDRADQHRSQGLRAAHRLGRTAASAQARSGRP